MSNSRCPWVGRWAAFALIVTVLIGLTASCEEDDPGPVEPFAKVDGDTLPPWAVGSFTRHESDVVRYRVTPDGTMVYWYEGGDVGGRGCGRALISGDEVRLVMFDDVTGEPHSERRLVRDATGALFVFNGAVRSKFDPADLCGRDVGGCGGYGRVEACSPAETAAQDAEIDACRGRLAKVVDRDAGGDADDSGESAQNVPGDRD